MAPKVHSMKKEKKTKKSSDLILWEEFVSKNHIKKKARAIEAQN